MWRAGCMFGDRHQRRVYDMCTMYVHGRVAPGKCRGGEEGGEGGKVYRAGARAVGRVTSVIEAYAVYVQCTCVEVSLPGSVGAARKAARGGRSYRADKCGARAVGSVTSVSEADAICVQCTYTEGSFPGSLRGPAKP